jgi:DNA-binding NarL/FixJ family response regulator
MSWKSKVWQPLAEQHFEPTVEHCATYLEEKVCTLCRPAHWLSFLLGREEEIQTLKARYADLTSRERDVMALVVAGLLNKQVGSRLDISEVTVKKHRGNAMRKMKAESLPQLVKMAARLRLPQPSPEALLAFK